jgi:hypothetical protein
LTDKEKAILIRLFIAGKKLSRSQKDSTAKQFAGEMADAVSDFLKEWSMRK